MAVIKQIPEEQLSISDPKYRVFLSFRGKDTRLSFIDHLYEALVGADITTFLDDQRIETGEGLKPELEKAIMESQASIIVLSKNFASSTWCLNELVMILEQRRKAGMIVLPIFYHVDPSHVRKQEDVFADAMKAHEESIEAETNLENKRQKTRTLKLWKDALTEVADLKGKDIKGWHETKFIQQIVTEIDHRLGNKPVSGTSHDLIGMSFQVQRIELWLQDRAVKGDEFLTIYGMGGIGKTSLAKYVYDRNFRLFESSCFLENIGKISTSVVPDGKLGLQRELLKNIKGKHDISTVNEGTRLIEKALKNKRVLLVLDDVDDVDQLDVLLGRKGFRHGSKIIITTKDRSLPKKCQVWNKLPLPHNYTEYLLEGLEVNESLELISRHAFRCTSPKDGYEEVSRKAAKYCEGHPLALKVLGSSLFERDVAAWEDTLELLEKEHNFDINIVLRISFDLLKSENDKKLFKYIVCFFIGKDLDYIKKVLKECDIRTSSGIPNLIDNCLLTIDSFNCVKMHRLLQDLGRHIIHQESLSKPWKRSILCCLEESFNVLKEDKGTDKIHGLILDMEMPRKKKSGLYNSTKEGNLEDETHKNSKPLVLWGWFQRCISRFWLLFDWVLFLCSTFYPEKGNLKTESFTKMTNLALVNLNFVQLTGSNEKFPKRLRWLCWHGFPSRYGLPDLPMANVVALDLSYSNLEQLSKMPKPLTSLKILDLSSSVKLVRIGVFSRLPNLERLILAGCDNLVEICESIVELQELALLDLSYCVKLRKLPRNMRKLKKIKSLLLDGCSTVFTEVAPQRPQSSWNLLPRSIVKLTLANNNLYNESFPKDFSCLSSLSVLDLSDNPMDSLPDCIRSLVRITDLVMWDCNNLKSVLNLPDTISALTVCGCESLEKITLHSPHSKPPTVATFECHNLKETQGIFKVEPMQKIITDRLGWHDLDFMKHQKVTIDYTFPSPTILLYEHGIFSTFSWDDKVPDWFTYKTNGFIISFSVPPSPKNLQIRGLNVCFVQRISDIPLLYILKPSPPSTKIYNMTKNLTWTYINQWKGDMVVLNHWMFQNNELEVGDLVCVSIGDLEPNCIIIDECGIGFVYDDLEAIKPDPLDYYKSWRRVVGRDLSSFRSIDDDNDSYLLERSSLVEFDAYTEMDDYVSSLFINAPMLEGSTS